MIHKMSPFLIVILSTLLSLVSTETNLVRRKRNTVIQIAQGQADNTKKHSSMFWDNEHLDNFVNYQLDERFAFDRFLQEFTSMSMSMSVPARPISAPAPVAAGRPVPRVPVPTSDALPEPTKFPSSPAAPVSAPVAETTTAPGSGNTAPVPVTEITAAPVSGILTLSPASVPVPEITTTPGSGNRTSAPTLAPVTSSSSAPVSGNTTLNSGCDSSVSRDQALFDLFLTVSNASQLEDASSPQNIAYNVMTDTAADPCGDPSKSLSLYGLLVLYFSTEGANWVDKDGWLVTFEYCEWYGITCNAAGEVIEITLDSNNLQGTPPSEMGAIESLQVLSAYSNNLTGTFPEAALSKWLNLRFIDLEDNRLVGPAFPAVLSQLTALEVYRVSINLLTGELSTAPFLQLQQLRELWVAANSIDGSIPRSISSLTGLESFIFYSNAITGQLPTEIGALNLTQFLAHDNLLTGPIPTQLLNNTFLIDLRLEENDLIGTIPSAIGELTYLLSLRLAGNSFTGPLPPEISRLSNLVILSVGGTSLSGTIRDAFEPFRALEFADFSKALFTGTLPASIFDIPTIKALYFHENDLTGTIPANYAFSPVLRDLYLNDNALSGSIPAIVPGQLSNLTEFLLDNNNLSGIMPSSVCDLRMSSALTLLTADHCTDPPKVVCDCCDSCSSEVP